MDPRALTIEESNRLGRDPARGNRVSRISGLDRSITVRALGALNVINCRARSLLPAVFVEWDGIQDVSTPANGGEAVDGSGKTGRYAGGRGYTTYRFGELRPGEVQSYQLTVSPIHKMNRSDVTFAAWRDTPDAKSVPRSPEITIHPCPGPLGDGH